MVQEPSSSSADALPAGPTVLEESWRSRTFSAMWDRHYRNLYIGNILQLGTFVVGVLAEFVGPQLAIGSLAATLIVMMAVVTLFTPRMRQLD